MALSPATVKSTPAPSNVPTLFRGTGGKPIDVSANYVQLGVDEGFGIFQYEVLFNPPIDSRDVRFQIIRNTDKLGTILFSMLHKLDSFQKFNWRL